MYTLELGDNWHKMTFYIVDACCKVQLAVAVKFIKCVVYACFTALPLVHSMLFFLHILFLPPAISLCIAYNPLILFVHNVYHTVVLNLKLGNSSVGESSSAGLTSSDGPSATSSQPMARPDDAEYSGEDEQNEEEEEDDEERTIMTGAASSSSKGFGGASVGRALVGGASAAGVSMDKSGDGFSRPKAPLAKQ
jgi:hypothetical protein